MRKNCSPLDSSVQFAAKSSLWISIHASTSFIWLFGSFPSSTVPSSPKPVYLKNVWGKGYVFQPEGERA